MKYYYLNHAAFQTKSTETEGLHDLFVGVTYKLCNNNNND